MASNAHIVPVAGRLLALAAIIGCAGCTSTAHTPVLRVPVVAAADWAKPYDVGGVLVRVPVPSGFIDVCSDTPEELESLRAKDRSVKTLGCYREAAPEPRLFARFSALAKDGDVGREEFETFKREVRAGVTANRNRAQGLSGGASEAGTSVAARAGVLDELRESKDHVVHAIARAEPGADALRPGVMTTVHVRGRLLYLTVLGPPGARLDWEALAGTGDEWAETLLKRTLWQR